jgi:hypothetical protein
MIPDRAWLVAMKLGSATEGIKESRDADKRESRGGQRSLVPDSCGYLVGASKKVARMTKPVVVTTSVGQRSRVNRTRSQGQLTHR